MTLTENFDDVSALSGWVMVNNSNPLGTTGWFQGNPGVFPAASGAANSYIAANFENAGFGGNISNWLLTPVLDVSDSTILRFETRTVGSPFPDRLEVRFSADGSGVDVGMTDASVGTFTTLLLELNPALAPGGYPDDWTAYELQLSGIPGTVQGRFGFRYYVGDTLVNADYIGIDNVSVTFVPEPGTFVFMGAGLLGLAAWARRRS